MFAATIAIAVLTMTVPPDSTPSEIEAAAAEAFIARAEETFDVTPVVPECDFFDDPAAPEQPEAVVGMIGCNAETTDGRSIYGETWAGSTSGEFFFSGRFFDGTELDTVLVRALTECIGFARSRGIAGSDVRRL